VQYCRAALLLLVFRLCTAVLFVCFINAVSFAQVVVLRLVADGFGSFRFPLTRCCVDCFTVFSPGWVNSVRFFIAGYQFHQFCAFFTACSGSLLPFGVWFFHGSNTAHCYRSVLLVHGCTTLAVDDILRDALALVHLTNAALLH